ncbi:unnamed protein product [Diabrotica balteata]|uniref:Uncharacterized protein n=1 Tax=Diabrotica balteata TaxID=107213 RepID=A0A9N9SRU7_DIABA|nr:unnamed protein product [Diabrotica balteata]
MFKLCIVAALLALSVASPAPEAKADPKPQVLAAYAAPVAYTSAYSAAPVAYSSYVAPAVYASGYSVYSPYTSPYVVY